MSKIPFDEKELKVVAEAPNFFGGINPVYDFPVSAREGYERFYRDNDPIWMPTDVESTTLCPSIIPDNIARAFVFEAEPWPQPYDKHKDMFGIEWVYVPVAGGSMENPEYPHLLEDVNDWEEKIIFPDIDSWDWEASAKLNEPLRGNGKAVTMMWLNGMGFERLISSGKKRV